MNGVEYSARTNGETRAQGCCPLYHEAVELVGRRWTGAILRVLMDGPLRFSEIAQVVPELSDRLLSERMKQLEARGIISRRVLPGPPIRVEYTLTDKGNELQASLVAVARWAERWVDVGPATSAPPPAPKARRTSAPRRTTSARKPSRRATA